MSEPRPKNLTPEMALAAAMIIAHRLKASGDWGNTSVEEIAADIAKHGRRYMDGYELAKALEDYAHWSCDLQMADELDAFSHQAGEQLRAAEKAWAERNSIAPPFPMGARVKVRSGEVGIIEGIDDYSAARYCIRLDGDTNPTRRYLYNFEDCELQP